MNRIMFARIGWMTYYAGISADDAKPKRGGSHNRRKIGSEVLNFKDVQGRLFGYVAAPSQDRVISLERIDPIAGEAGDLDGVLVVFVSTAEDRNGRSLGQKIVGWYKDARVFRGCHPHPEGTSAGRVYNIQVDSENAVLLPTANRFDANARGKGGMGQSNVRYLVDCHGDVQKPAWVGRVVRLIKSYRGENLLTNPQAEGASRTEDELEALAGLESNPGVRAEIEKRAMKVARDFYIAKRFSVTDKSKTESYDLLCRKGDRDLEVEVKGTRTKGDVICLTRKEVELARARTSQMELCVVHSIALTKAPRVKASGGTLVRYRKWNPDLHETKPISFNCFLKTKLGQEEDLQ